MKTKSESTREIDARTNQKVEPLPFDVNTHDDYLRLREQFARMPKIPTLLHVDEAPMTKAPSRTYNWFLTSEQSGGSIAIHPSRVAGQVYVIVHFTSPDNTPRALLLESTSGEIIKRALPNADPQGELMMVLNENNEADASFLRLLADPTSTGTFVA